MGSLESSSNIFSGTKNSKEAQESFEETFHLVLISTILKDKPQNTVKSWVQKVVEYNVPNGKMIRGKLVEAAFKALTGEKEGRKVQQAQILGWCVEILQAGFLIVDDLMDNGTTRRGQPCWYKVENMGSIVTNDALILESLVYQILKLHFGNSNIYTELMNLIHIVNFNTTLGQSLDTRYSCANEKGQFFDQPVMQFYHSIVTLKTSYYTIFLPIALAMVLADFKSTENCDEQHLWKTFEKIALKIGTFFQIQDDYFDCFADKEITGKEGSDIQEGKCTWLYAKAMELSDQRQKSVLMENYGFDYLKKISTIKDLYSELDLPCEFLKVRNEMSADILSLIESLDHDLLKKVLKQTFNQIFNRVC